MKPTGYDESSITSYAIFRQLQQDSVIPQGVRFQVGLPSPLGVVRGFVESDYCSEIEPLYEHHLLQALDRIQDHIPRKSLTIQWDIPFEVAMLEYESGQLKDPFLAPYFPNVQEGILDRLIRLASKVAADVEMGFHLCYGDFGHVHFVEPEDTAMIVNLANEIILRISPVHAISYIHMPVPKSRTDRAYFEPLNSLRLGKTQLYLGLVHPHDKDGTKARIAACKEVFSGEFGIASECGMGRTPREDFDSILAISAEFS